MNEEEIKQMLAKGNEVTELALETIISDLEKLKEEVSKSEGISERAEMLWIDIQRNIVDLGHILPATRVFTQVQNGE